MAKLEAIEPVKKKRLGLLEESGFVLPESFWEPLAGEELAAWEGSESGD